MKSTFLKVAFRAQQEYSTPTSRKWGQEECDLELCVTALKSRGQQTSMNKQDV